MNLLESYTIAYEKVTHCTNIFLKITTNSGLTGWGCAAPDLPVTGEKPEDVLGVYKNNIEVLLKGKDIFDYAKIMYQLKKKIPTSYSALAMVDMALFDLMAQKAGVPLYKLLGGFRSSLPTSITIGIMPVGEMLFNAERYYSRGFRILKIKGGINVDEDIERIRMLNEKYGKIIKIRFDANQGYSVEDSVKFIRETKNAGIELFEQPTRRDNLDMLKQVTQKVPVPVMADESLMSLKDAFNLTKNKCSDLINIKLMKTGGILEAMHINSVAKAAGVEVMVGCMDESALGIAAGLHFALSRSNIKYADLDGNLDILDDPFMGILRLKDGVLYPSPGIGLGWHSLANPNF